MNEAVAKYRKKFFTSLGIQIPIIILMWVIPYVVPEFVEMVPLPNRVPLFVLILCFFASIIQFYIGSSFYINSYKSLRNKSANMDVLIMLGTSAAWLYAFVYIFIGYNEHMAEDLDMLHMTVMEHAHNFEISSSLITIILLGKFLETLSKKKTVDKLAQLASLKVTKAIIIEK